MARLHIWERWDWDRFVRLAAFLNLTVGELASVACIRHASIASLEKRNRLYNGGSQDRAGAMVLTLLEAHVAREYSNDVILNPFPNLNKMPPSAATSSKPEQSFSNA